MLDAESELGSDRAHSLFPASSEWLGADQSFHGAEGAVEMRCIVSSVLCSVALYIIFIYTIAVSIVMKKDDLPKWHRETRWRGVQREYCRRPSLGPRSVKKQQGKSSGEMDSRFLSGTMLPMHYIQYTPKSCRRPPLVCVSCRLATIRDHHRRRFIEAGTLDSQTVSDYPSEGRYHHSHRFDISFRSKWKNRESTVWVRYHEEQSSTAMRKEGNGPIRTVGPLSSAPPPPR